MVFAVEKLKILNFKTINVVILPSRNTAPSPATHSCIRDIRKRGTSSVSSTLQENTKRIKKKIRLVAGFIKCTQISLIFAEVARLAQWREHSPLTNINMARVRSRTRCHTWIEFVGALACSGRFISGFSGFPLSPKTSI